MNWSELRRVFRTACRVFRAAFPSRLKRLIEVWTISGLFAASVQAQTGDWRAVEILKPGSPVRVRTDERRIRCSVEGATDTELFCEVQGRLLRTSTLSILRSEIQEVRVLPNPDQAKDTAIGAAIGAGVVATDAAINPRVPRGARGAYAIFGGLAGAGLGALTGALVPVFQIIFQRGKLIYKR